MRRRFGFVLAVLALAGTFRPAPAAAQTTAFTVPLNNVSSTLGATHLNGSGTLEVAKGEGPLFGTPTPTAPIRVTVARKNTLVNDQVVQGSTFTIYKATGRSGDILTGITAVEGTADRNYAKGDVVRMAITAGYLADLHAAVNAVEAAVANTAADTTVLHKTAVDETAGGTKTFTLPIVGSVTGNAGTVTNGVYTTGDQTIVGLKTFRAPDPSTDAVRHQDSTGTLLHSIGPGGKQTIRVKDPLVGGSTSPVFIELNNVAADATTTVPFVFTYGAGTLFAGVPDNVFSMGWDRAPGLSLPGFSMNWENSPRHLDIGQYPLGVLENHTNYTSPDGTVDFRPMYWFISNSSYYATCLYRGGNWSWQGITAAGGDVVPVLLSVTPGMDSNGTVVIQNDSNNLTPPLQVIGTASNLFFTLNAGQQIYYQTGQAATAGAQSRNGLSLVSRGAYWNGSASVSADTTLGTTIVDPATGLFRLDVMVGAAQFKFRSDGRMAVGVAGDPALITQNITMGAGHIGAIGPGFNATYRLIGLTGGVGTERVTIDADLRGTELAGPIRGGLGIGAAPIAAGADRLRIGDQIFYEATVGNQGTLSNNAYYNGADWVRAAADSASAIRLHSGGVHVYTGASGAAGSSIAGWDSTGWKFSVTNNGNVAIGGGGGSFGGGVGSVIWIANATTAPTANPTGGGVLYVTGGNLTYRSPGGTTTVIGPN